MNEDAQKLNKKDKSKWSQNDRRADCFGATDDQMIDVQIFMASQIDRRTEPPSNQQLENE